MKSEFHHIELNRIRYSIVWEDYESFYTGLDIQRDDELLVITSAGCNVLNAVLKQPKRIIAVDINPYQNKLLDFKIQLYKYSDYDTLATLLGIRKNSTCLEALVKVKGLFLKEDYEAWKDFFELHPDGLLSSGQLEKYIISFYPSLNEYEQLLTRKLFSAINLDEQSSIFNELIENTAFELKFKKHFDDEHLSKGRDSRLFKYADENGGVAFYNRFANYTKKGLLKNNFYLNFFFFGITGIDESILPPCYRLENFHIIKNNCDLIEMHTSDVIEYIEQNEAETITKTSLSNIFEYTSTGDFEQAIASIKHHTKINTILFWNLLHEQGISKPSIYYINNDKSDLITHTESCFYFKNVRVLNI